MNNEEHKDIPSLEELLKRRTPSFNANSKQKENLNTIDRLAVWITKYIGSMGFFLIIFIWTVGWLGWNSFAPKELAFDPRPAFVLWLIISNMIQILLMPLIMIGQNIQGRHSELRAETDFHINKRSEKEIEVILMHLENQNKKIAHITELLEKK